jgi:chromosome segregation ATPase
MTQNLFSFVSELTKEINQHGLTLFDYIKELNQEIENNRQLVKDLDFTIVQMKKELREREISQKRYLAKIQTLEKREKLDNIIEKLSNTDFNKGRKNPC